MRTRHAGGNRLDLAATFYQGNYLDVLRSTIDAVDGLIGVGDESLVIGALCFQSRVEEAQRIFRKAALSEEARLEACFYLGVGACRRGQYDDARRHFAANLATRRTLTDRGRFFAFQGLAFFRYFQGRYRSAARAARAAYFAAMDARFLYGKALSADLLGHALVQTGAVAEGLARLEDAAQFAHQLGNGGLVREMRMSRAIYSAQFGLDPANDITRLQQWLGDDQPQNSYSRSNLLLELARQHALRGDLAEGRRVLDEACTQIYAAQNTRQGIILSLRYAAIAQRSGDSHQALNLVRMAASELRNVVDLGLALQVEGLRRSLQEELDVGCLASSETELQRLLRRTGAGINARMEARRTGRPLSAERPSDDRLGNLMDGLAQKRSDSVAKCLELGLLGLLHGVFGIKPGARVVVLDPLPGTLLLFDGGNVWYRAEGLSPLLRAILCRLAAGPATKEQLIHEIWKYSYSSIRHDALIYRIMSRLRILLAPHGGWVNFDEPYYFLEKGVAIASNLRTALELPTQMPPPLVAASEPNAPEPGVAPLLNMRQRQILKTVQARGELDVQACVDAFGISLATARRDLSQLAELSLVQRVGRARATRYVSVSNSL